MDDNEAFLTRSPDSTELIVLLHAFRNRSDRLRDLREVIGEHCRQADVYAPAMRTLSFSCRIPAEDIVAELTNAISRIVAARQETAPYQKISLVGHSAGAVFARKISIIAHGEQEDKQGTIPTPFEPRLAQFRKGVPWASLITRVLLLAGTNRGWNAESGTNTLTSYKFAFGQFVGELLGGKFTVFSLRRGAPFLVQTRLQWLALMNTDYGARPNLTIVQLLGTVDDVVAPDDSIDFAIDGVAQAGHPSSYNYLEVRHSGHDDIVEMSATGPVATASARAERRKQFLLALTASPAELMGCRINREQMQDTLPPPPDPTVENMVFVIHGIRDKGFWTKKIARAIKEESGSRPFASLTESYGYFAMLPFLLPTVRRRKVAWLMDRYCEARARYPNAVFHYVGHSNGTYLAARALRDYPAARFSRIVFVGSVVRHDYDWQTLIDSRRVHQVLNYVATEDWVVAFFGRGLQRYVEFDIGSAGHDGFSDTSINQVRFIQGGHDSGHEEAAWGSIARFIVHGVAPASGELPSHIAQTWATAVIGMLARGLLPVVVIVVAIPLPALTRRIAEMPGATLATIGWTLLTVSLLGLLRFVFMRV